MSANLSFNLTFFLIFKEIMPNLIIPIALRPLKNSSGQWRSRKFIPTKVSTGKSLYQWNIGNFGFLCLKWFLASKNLYRTLKNIFRTEFECQMQRPHTHFTSPLSFPTPRPRPIPPPIPTAASHEDRHSNSDDKINEQETWELSRFPHSLRSPPIVLLLEVWLLKRMLHRPGLDISNIL